MRVSRTILRADRAAAEIAEEYRLAEWVLRALQPVFEAPVAPAVPPEQAPSAIRQIGRYRVLGPIGEGGFATVYRVADASGAVRAAKLLRDDGHESAELQARFQREIEILERLHHPSVVRVYDHGTHGSTPYFIMDYVDGSSLHSLLARTKRLTPTGAAFVGARLAEVYEYIHEFGIVRNDIKPSNIMINSDGRLIVIDFGISRLEGVGTLTATGAVIGTPRYMSPEQVKGDRVDRRSDVFSLGALLYEMVTGSVAFKGSSIHEELMKVVTEMPPPPSTLAPVSPELEAIIVRALAKDPAARFATMQQLGEALAPFGREVDLAALAQNLEASAAAAARNSTVIRSDTAGAPSSVIVPPTVVNAPVPELAHPAAPVPRPWDTQIIPGSPSKGPGQYDDRPAPVRQTVRTPPPPPLWTARPGAPPLPMPAAPAAPPPPPVRSPSPATAVMPRPQLFTGEPDVLELLFDLEHSLLVTSSEPDRVVSLAKGQVIVGRALTCDVVVNRPTLSRQHAMFSIADGQVSIEDLGSRNDIVVNGRKVPEATLANGDEICLGDVKMRILFGAL